MFREVKLAFVFGTRPEVIKLAPVIKLASNYGFKPIIISTSQHKQLLRLALDAFNLVPHYDLDIMLPSQSLFQITIRGLERLGKLLEDLRPDALLAQGDTTTAFVSALSAFYLRIRFGHVEAGLRTRDLSAPFPEEANRQMIARIATWHFAPTKMAMENLYRENVSGTVIMTGNTVVDALELLKPKLDQIKLPKPISSLKPRSYILVEVHRRENFGRPMMRILKAVKELSRYVKVVFPVHPNPNVRHAVRETALDNTANIILLEPVDYLTMLKLISEAKLIITDSGGLQEEAPSFNTPVLVTREKTERPEGIEIGVLRIVGTDTERIIGETKAILEDDTIHERLAEKPNPYGDGRASVRILEYLQRTLS